MFNKRSNNPNERFNPYGQQQFSQQGFPPQGPFPQQYPQQPNMPPAFQTPGSMYPSMQFERLQFEIKENRRRINNLAKRIIRIENYLRIRDTSDYAIIDEDQQIPNEYSL